MKEIKGYTPTPWEVKDCHDDTRTAEIKSGNKNIATVWAYNNGKQQIDFNEQSANATLIAAAPSLYEENIKLREGIIALRLVLDLITTSPEWIKNYGGGAVDKKAATVLKQTEK